MGFYSFWSITDTAAVLSLVPVIGAVSSQIGAAANIISSVSSAGAEIIDVGERYMSKHNVPEPTVESTFESEPNVQMEPLANTTPEMSPSPPQLSPVFFNVLPRPANPVMTPLIAPIVQKNNYPERRILKVRRPSARDRNSIYQKDEELDELTDRMGSLNIGGNVPKSLKTGGIFGASMTTGKGGTDGSAWMRAY